MTFWFLCFFLFFNWGSRSPTSQTTSQYQPDMLCSALMVVDIKSGGEAGGQKKVQYFTFLGYKRAALNVLALEKLEYRVSIKGGTSPISVTFVCFKTQSLLPRPSPDISHIIIINFYIPLSYDYSSTGCLPTLFA